MDSNSSTRRPQLPTASYVAEIRKTCAALRIDQNIDVTPADIKRLLFSPSFLSSFKRVSGHHGLNFPLNFPSIHSEINFLSILSLLNFASGYRVPLHYQTGRGAWDNIRAFMFGLYLTSSTGQGDLLTAKGMQTITEHQVADLMSVNLHVEEPHSEIPGLSVGKLGGPIFDLVKLITMTLRETGEVLESIGERDLGCFVIRSFKEADVAKRNADSNASVDVVLSKIVGTFRAFQDMAIVDSQPVYCFKKALFLVHAIVIRFGSSSRLPFQLPNTSQIPVFSDNVLPSMLVHFGVIDLSKSTAHGLHAIFPGAADEARINSLLDLPQTASQNSKAPLKEGPMLDEEQSYILRAAAVDACERIIEVARSLDEGSLSIEQKWIKDITLPELDLWLWAVAKDRPDYRELERFVRRDTVFF
ncbi:hypothetical protein V8B97DRAFT_1864333 [Scleroderma yunnanense]